MHESLHVFEHMAPNWSWQECLDQGVYDTNEQDSIKTWYAIGCLSLLETRILLSVFNFSVSFLPYHFLCVSEYTNRKNENSQKNHIFFLGMNLHTQKYLYLTEKLRLFLSGIYKRMEKQVHTQKNCFFWQLYLKRTEKSTHAQKNSNDRSVWCSRSLFGPFALYILASARLHGKI